MPSNRPSEAPVSPGEARVSPRFGARSAKAALCGLVAFTYLPVLGLWFASDDMTLVVPPNPAGLLEQLSTPLWGGHGPLREASYFRPTMTLDLALDRAAWGLSAPAYHLESLAWHLVAVLALFTLLERRFGSLPALFGGGVFGLHPVQSEVVAWISARNDSLAVAVALALCAALVLDSTLVSWSAAALAGGLVLLSLGSKETAVVAVTAALAWVALGERVGGQPRPDRHQRVFALLIPLATFTALRVHAVGAALPAADSGLDLPSARWAAAAGHYGRLLAWPTPLSDSVTLTYLHVSPLPTALGWCVLAAGGVVLVARGGRHAAWALVLAAALFLPVIPAIAAKKILAERYLYAPLAAIAWAVAAAVPRGRATAIAGVLLAIPSIAIIGFRIPEWTDTLSLAESGVAAAPSPFSWGWRGVALAAAGKYPAAAEDFERAFTGEPPFCAVATRALLVLHPAPALAVKAGYSAFDRGCGSIPGFREAWALSMFRSGDRHNADRVMSPRPERCGAGEPVVSVALALALDGEDAAAACAASFGDPVPLVAEARGLLATKD